MKSRSILTSGSDFSHELGHRNMTVMGDALLQEHVQNRLKENPAIEAKTPMVHIPDVQPESFLPTDSVPAIHLRPARDARFHIVTAHLFRRVALEVLHEQRARANQAHLTFQNVPQLGQLIQAETTQQASRRGQSLMVWKKAAARIAGISHRSEFQQLERLRVVARAYLTKQHRGAHRAPHGQSYDSDERRKNE